MKPEQLRRLVVILLRNISYLMSDECFGFDHDTMKKIKQEAAITVKSMFNDSHQLNSIDIFLEKETKNYLKLEQSLKAIVDDHSSKLQSLKEEMYNAHSEIVCLKENSKVMLELTQEYKKHEKSLKKLIKCAQDASTLNQTLNLLRHIINMNETLEATKEHLDNKQLLVVHKNLRDLEDVRDKILGQFFSISSSAVAKTFEQNLLIRNFEPIKNLNNSLLIEIKTILVNLIEFSKNDPCMLVSVLRIIEREESLDVYWSCNTNDRHTNKRYIPDDRPKKWSMLVDVCIETYLIDNINKIKNTYLNNNEHGFTDFIFRVRDSIASDIKIIQSYTVRCFPPHYCIITRFSRICHEVLIDTLNTFIMEWGDNPTEANLVAVLIFEKEYLSSEFFGNTDFHPEIIHHIKALNPLINLKTYQQLEHLYLAAVFMYFQAKVDRIVGIEKQLMEADKEPPKIDNKFVSFNKNFYQDFVGYKIQYACKLSSSTYLGVFKHCIFAFEQLLNQYENLYRNYVKEQFDISSSGNTKAGITSLTNYFKSNESNDEPNRKFAQFGEFSICVANNLNIIRLAAEKMKQEITCTLETSNSVEKKHSLNVLIDDYAIRINNLNTFIEEFVEKCIVSIVNEFILDLRNPFDHLLGTSWKDFPQKWSQCFSGSLLTFFETLGKFESMYLSKALTRLDYSIARKYLDRFLNYKSKYTDDQLEEYGSHLYNDGMFLSKFFSSNLNISEKDTYSYAIVSCASVFKTRDQGAALIVLAQMYKTFSDFTFDHGFALIHKRSDLKNDQIKEILEDIVNKRRLNEESKSSVFSIIEIVK